MTMDSKLSPVLAELERITPLLQRQFLIHETGGVPGRVDIIAPSIVIKPPVITFASRGKKRTTNGWYMPTVWTNTADDVLAELAGETPDQKPRGEVVLASEILHDPVATVSELTRQLFMHALWAKNTAHGTMPPHMMVEAQRPTPSEFNGSYYPEWRWHDMVDGILLHTATVNPDQPARGWSDWKPKQEFIDWVTKHVNRNVFEQSRAVSQVKEKVGSRMRKWRCECTTIRAAVEVEALCLKCKTAFQWAEATAPPVKFSIHQAWVEANPEGSK